MAAETPRNGLYMLGISVSKKPLNYLATAGRAATGVALHAGAVADQRVVAAFAAGLAFIALHLGLGAGVDTDRAAGNRGGRFH